MWIILFLLAGGLTGFFLQKFTKMNVYAEKITSWLIYVLLFTMGLVVGTDPAIMGNLAGLGLQALQIALLSMLGSVVFAWLVSRIINFHEK